MHAPFFSAAHQGRIEVIKPPTTQNQHERLWHKKNHEEKRQFQSKIAFDGQSDDGDTMIASDESEIELQVREGRNLKSRHKTKIGTKMLGINILPEVTTTGSLKTHSWINLWISIVVLVVLWDAGYCFMRPRSMKGGDLHWIWQPYSIYQEVDYIYGVKALREGNGFTNAQSLLNVVEALLNITYLYAAHIVAWPPATLVGFTAAVMTLSKTVLYWAQEYYCSYCAIGHNSTKSLVLYYIIPNGLWIVLPTLIVIQFSKDLVGSLNLVAASTKKLSSEKAL